MRTVPRVNFDDGVNGSNVTDAEPPSVSGTDLLWIVRPSTSRVIATDDSAGPRLIAPAVTVTRSCPSNVDRCNTAGVIARLLASPSATDRVVTVAPSGRRTPSAP